MTLEALKVGGLPVALGLAGLVVARCVRPSWRGLVAGATVALAGLAVHAAVAGWPSIPPKRSLDVVALLGCAGVLLAALPGRGGALGLGVLLSVACPWFVVGRLHEAPPGGLAAWTLGSSALLSLLWWPLFGSAAGSRSRVVAAPGVLALVGAGAAAGALFSNSAKAAELTGGVAACLGVVALLTLWRPCAHVARGASLAGAVSLSALLIHAQHFVEVPARELALLAAGWASLHLGPAPFVRRGSERRAMVLQGLLAALPVAAALVLGWLRYQAALESDPYAY